MVISSDPEVYPDGKPSLLLYSALSTSPFRYIKLRSRRTNCAACGIDGKKSGAIAETDYVAFCGGPRPDWEILGMREGSVSRRIHAKVGFDKFMKIQRLKRYHRTCIASCNRIRRPTSSTCGRLLSSVFAIYLDRLVRSPVHT